MRTLALAAAASLTSACFYTEVINVAPQAQIERIDSLTTVTRSDQIIVSARASTDPDGDTLRYAWRASTCASCPSALGSDMQFRYSVFDAHQPVRFELVVTDDHGATSLATLTVQVANQAPDVDITPQGTENPDGSYTVGRTVYFKAVGNDPDGDPVVQYDFSLIPPPASDPGAYRFTRVDFQTYSLEPDVPGRWEVEVTARDAYGGMDTARRAVAIGEDLPPYIAATLPEWKPDARVILLRSAGPRRFIVASVADDLDPYPGSPDAHFRWWVKVPGASLVEVPGHDLAELTVDPSDLDPGDELEVRVEIADRRARTLPCAPAQAACSLTSDDHYQRLTWTAEVR